MEITKKLKQLRLKNGYSQMWVSKELGYKTNALTRKEKGKREFTVKDIRKLCDLYNISPSYLLSDDNKEEGAGNEENISESK